MSCVRASSAAGSPLSGTGFSLRGAVVVLMLDFLPLPPHSRNSDALLHNAKAVNTALALSIHPPLSPAPNDDQCPVNIGDFASRTFPRADWHATSDKLG